MVLNGAGLAPGSEHRCAWWDLVCQGGHQVADAGLSAITHATAAGAYQLLGEVVKTIDESTQVPITDPTYQRIYAGFLGLAAPLMGVVFCLALVVAAVRRDPGTLGRAVSGLVVVGIGGALYLVLAQLLVGLDNWLSHGVVRVTGHDVADGLTDMAAGFSNIAGARGEVTANMLILLLMVVMLVAGVVLWFVLVLRKIAILVVVAFAPLLIAGYLWAPTRPWVRRATEVLVALVFTKTAIYALFGIGLALLARGGQQSLSDFVGAVVLLSGACFTPLLMLRLVHFAADTQVAGEMMGTLRGGVQPIVNRLPMGGSNRHEMARHSAQSPSPDQARGHQAATLRPDPATETGAGTGAGGGSGAGGAGSGAGAGAGGAAAGATGAAALVAQKGFEAVRQQGQHLQSMASDLTPDCQVSPAPDAEPPLAGPPPLQDKPPTHPGPDGGTS
jgi:type IV secretion system protein TrbL